MSIGMIIQNEAVLTEAIREVVATTFSLNVADVHESLSAAESPAWDSLHHFTLIVTLEDQFGVTYTSDEIPQMTSIPAIARVTAAHLGLNE
jgi:acyl carrier protein